MPELDHENAGGAIWNIAHLRQVSTRGENEGAPRDGDSLNGSPRSFLLKPPQGFAKLD